MLPPLCARSLSGRCLQLTRTARRRRTAQLTATKSAVGEMGVRGSRRLPPKTAFVAVTTGRASTPCGCSPRVHQWIYAPAATKTAWTVVHPARTAMKVHGGRQRRSAGGPPTGRDQSARRTRSVKALQHVEHAKTIPNHERRLAQWSCRVAGRPRTAQRGNSIDRRQPRGNACGTEGGHTGDTNGERTRRR